MVPIAALVAGCGVSSQPAPRRVEPAPTTTTLDQSSPAPSFSSEDVDAWIKFRKAYGLRSDREWVLHVAAQPGSFGELPVPILPSEGEAMMRRDLDVLALVPALSAYGVQFGASYGGAFIDGPTAVVRFTDDIDAHQASLEAIFGMSTPIRVEEAQFGLGVLAAHAADVERQAGWFPQVSAILYSAEADVLSNRVRVRYQARDDAMEPAIRAHFGDPEWMELKLYGGLPWDGPTGDLLIRVVNPEGSPVTASCNPEAIKPSAYNMLPQDTDAQGLCAFRGVPATAYVVLITLETVDGSQWRRQYQVAAASGGSTPTTIVVDP